MPSSSSTAVASSIVFSSRKAKAWEQTSERFSEAQAQVARRNVSKARPLPPSRGGKHATDPYFTLRLKQQQIDASYIPTESDSKDYSKPLLFKTCAKHHKKKDNLAVRLVQATLSSQAVRDLYFCTSDAAGTTTTRPFSEHRRGREHLFSAFHNSLHQIFPKTPCPMLFIGNLPVLEKSENIRTRKRIKRSLL